MKNTIILYSILSIFIVSCASRKVNVDKVDTVIKTDSTSVTKQETITTQDNHVSVVTNTDELEISPLFDTIPMIVNGITYKNAKLRYKKTKKVLVDTTKIKVSEKASIEVNVEKDTKIKTFKKEIDKKADYLIYLGWFFVILLILLGYYTYRKINKTLI
jgi:hypothetical protein